MKTLSKNISRYRKELGFTQNELAKKLGLTFQAVSKWETGKTLPDILLLPKISSVLEVSIDKLLGYPTKEKELNALRANLFYQF